MTSAPPSLAPATPTASPVKAALRYRTADPIVSVHDVMPETMGHVEGILKRLKATTAPHPILLIVPGRSWHTSQLAQLRAWADSGITLAGHGWTHETPPPGTLYHRMHSAVLSRNVAEHLALDTDGIAELLHRNHAWFAEQHLPEPELYVPPAWALGAIPRVQLARLPFRYYETLTGIYDARENRFHTLPLTGYEADTPLRAHTLRALNRVNTALAHASKRPLRIAIHPHDVDLRLRGDLERALDKAWAGAGAASHV